MAVVRWDPWGELAALQRDVGQLLTRGVGEGAVRGGLVPPIDAYRSEEGLVVRIELPGMSPDDVDVSVQDNVLTISGERRHGEGVEEDAWVRRERAVGTFERSFSLPEGTRSDQISASYEHGVLELRIPHPEERRPQKIQISGGQRGQTVDVETPQQGA